MAYGLSIILCIFILLFYVYGVSLITYHCTHFIQFMLFAKYLDNEIAYSSFISLVIHNNNVYSVK